MDAVEKFNGLNGAKVTRKQIDKIILIASAQEQKEVVDRLTAVLQNNPKDKLFLINLNEPAINAMPGSLVPCFQVDDINEDTGLNGVPQQEVYDMVTDLILNTIKQVGHLPWQKEWKGAGGGNTAKNYVSKKAYTGVNFLLNFDIKLDKDGQPYLVPINFKQPYYLTFKQIENAGAKLRKGSKSRKVFYYTQIFSYKKGDLSFRTPDRAVFNGFIKENGISAEDKHSNSFIVPIIKYYNVYRADDCTGLKFLEDTVKKIKVEPIETAQAVVDSYPNPPKFTFGGDGAFYMPKTDIVNMPVIESFNKPEFYYSTYFHELVHSTGHSKRLDRGFNNRKGNGSIEDKKAYAFEELVAELGAVYLCSEAGILFTTKENNAKYLSHWNGQLEKILKDDNKFFFRAAAAAQKGTDFILDFNDQDIPAYITRLLKAEPKKAEKPIKATKPKAVQKPSNQEGKRIGYAILDNISGDVIASKAKLEDLQQVFIGLEVNKAFAKLPVLVHEIILSKGKNKVGKKVNVDWKRPSAEPIKRTRKKADPQQLSLGLNGKAKKKGLGIADVPQTEPLQPLQCQPKPFQQDAAEVVSDEAVFVNDNVRPGSIADRRRKRANVVREYYKIPDAELAEFLGQIEIKEKESVVVTIAAPQGAGKSRFLFQVIETFGQNYRCGHASMEEHPESSLYEDKADEYLSPHVQNSIVNPEIKTFSEFEKLVMENEVIFVDSWSKLQELERNIGLDKDLRKKFDGKLFFIIYQLTVDGKMRGGSTSQFDGDIILMGEKSEDYRENKIVTDKNRYNKIPACDLKFNIFTRKMLRSNMDNAVVASQTLTAPSTGTLIFTTT